MVRDFHHALRSLARNWRFALVCIVLLGVGIGTNIAVFGFADFLFFRQPAVPESERVVGIYGERGGKLRLPSCGLGIAVPREVGTSEVTSLYSNGRAVVFRMFLVVFHYN